MIKAFVHASIRSDGFHSQQHICPFEDLATAEAEYARLKAILDKKEQRGNDLENITEIITAIGSVSFVTRDLINVSIEDLSKADASYKGVRDAFPNALKR